METKANFIAIGLFTLILTAIGFGMIYWIARIDDNVPMRKVIVHFEGSIAGLVKGGQVQFNGIKVGEISDMNYDKTDPRFVNVALNVDPRVPLKQDSIVELQTQGLTGVGYIHIKGGSVDKPNLFDNPQIPELTAASSAFEDLMAGARSIMGQTEVILKQVQTLIAANENHVNTTMANVETFTTALKDNSDNIDTFLTDASGAAKGLNSLSKKLETLSSRAETLIAAIDPESVKKTVGSVETFSINLAKASNRFDGVVSETEKAAKDISAFSSGLNTTLTRVDNLVASIDPEAIKGSLASLQNFSKSLEESSEDIDLILTEAKQAAGNVNTLAKTISDRGEDFSHIITDAREIATRLNNASKRIDGLLGKADTLLSGDGESKGMVEEITLAARSIRNISEKFEGNADQIAKGLTRFSTTGLRNAESMIGDARNTLKKLEATIDKLDSDPSSLVFGSGNKVKTYNKRY